MLFVVIVSARGGPPPTSVDTASVVGPTTSLADGDLSAAARQSLIPQPPGYPLLAAPVVAGLRPLIGSATWCSDRPLPYFVRYMEKPCTSRPSRSGGRLPPPWYRSQAVLGLLAWIVLAAGAVSLLRAAGAGGGYLEVGLVLLLAAVPAASDALVRSFHPQDLVCVGLISAGLAAALRRRWSLSGVAFGVAVLCKQFALLPMLAVVVAVPGWRARARLVVPAVVVLAAGILPFLVVDATQTWRDLGDTAAGSGYLVTGTLVGLSHLSGSAKVAVSRDGPIALSLVLALWARRRAGAGLLRPAPLIGLAVACLATRLVFETVVESYYLLAVSAMLVVLDLSLKRVPVRSMAWVALGGAWAAGIGAGLSPTAQAAAVLTLSLAAVVMGVLEVSGTPSPLRLAAPGPAILSSRWSPPPAPCSRYTTRPG